MRPLLTKPSVPDDELIKELNIAASAEAERKMKFMSGEKQRESKPSCNQVTAPAAGEQMVTNAPREKGKGLVDQVSAIQAEVASVRKVIGNLTANQQPPIPPRQSREYLRSCSECRRAAKPRQYDHCFRCGISDHYARGCCKNFVDFLKVRFGRHWSGGKTDFSRLQCTLFYRPDFRGCGSINLQSESIMLKNVISRKRDPLFAPLLVYSNVGKEYEGTYKFWFK